METGVSVCILLLCLAGCCRARNCPDRKFPCDKDRCIPVRWRCDGVVDCGDHQDERGCGTVTCGPKYWRCYDGRCVPEKWRCDGQTDCRDSSDEDDCDVTTTSSPASAPTTPPVIRPFRVGTPLLMTAMGNKIHMVYVSHMMYPASKIKTISDFPGDIKSIDVHVSRRILCWVEEGTKTVSCGHLTDDLDLTKTRVLYSPKTGAFQPAGVAIDWTHNLVYWTDSGLGTISAGSLEEEWKGQTTLTRNAAEPSLIIVDPRNKWLFVAEDGVNIVRYNQEATDRRILIEGNMEKITGLEMDLTLDRVFWLDDGLEKISSCGLYGGDRTEHRSLPWGSYAGLLTLTQDSQTLLFYGGVSGGKVMGFNLGSKREKQVLDLEGRTKDLVFFESTKQPEGENACHVHTCSHICIPKSFGGYSCLCPESLYLSKDGKNCLYKNMVTRTKGCTDYFCKCPPPSTKFGSQCVYEDTLMEVTEDGDWKSVNILGFSDKEMRNPCPNVRATSIAVDIAESAVWFAQSTGIYRNGVGPGPKLTSCEKIFTQGIEDPRSLALDWVNRNLYWMDAGPHTISVASLVTHSPVVLISTGLEVVRGLAVDPIHGWLYWTNYGNHMYSRVERSGLDGGARQEVVKEGLHTPNTLTIDFESSRLLIGESVLQVILSCSLSGTNCVSLSTSKRPETLHSIAVLGQYVYWSDERTQSVYRLDKENATSREVVDDPILHKPQSIAFFHSNIQPNGTSVCGSNNGGCLICLPTRDSSKPFKCACPTGTKLSANGKTCETIQLQCVPGYRWKDSRCYEVDECTTQRPCSHSCTNTDGSFVCHCRMGYKLVDKTSCELRGPEPRLLIADGRFLHIMDKFHTPEVRSRPVVWPEGYYRKKIFSVEADVDSGTIFWIEREAIKSALLEDNRIVSPSTLLNFSSGFPESLAFDWLHNNLYWTDSRKRRIDVVSVARGITRTVHKRLWKPRAIAVDPAKGNLYWTTWGKHAAIHTSRLMGAQRSVLLQTKNRWPNGLTIDYSERRLYWTDGRNSVMFSSDMSGQDTQVVIMRHTSKPQLMFSVAVLEDYVYWTDWKEMFLSRVRRKGGKIESFSSPALRRPTDLKVIHSSRQIASTTVCSSNNGGCSHFCTASDHILLPMSCLCPDDMVLGDDQLTCETPDQEDPPSNTTTNLPSA